MPEFTDQQISHDMVDLFSAAMEPTTMIRFVEEVQQWDVEAEAKAVSAPTLLIHTRDNPNFDMATTRRVASLIKNSRVAFLDNALEGGHLARRFFDGDVADAAEPPAPTPSPAPATAPATPVSVTPPATSGTPWQLGSKPEIKYVETPDGVSIAYTEMGQGIPLLQLNGWPFCHLQAEWSMPTARLAFERVAERSRLIRFDPRGSGMSQRDVDDLSLDARVLDVETLIDHLGLDRVAMFAYGTAGPVAIAYAARHPDRVSHLMLAESFARASDYIQSDRAQGLSGLITSDWELFTETLASVFFGFSEGEFARKFAAYMRACVTPEQGRRALAAGAADDVTALLPDVRAITLVSHGEGSVFSGQDIAGSLIARIPNATLRTFGGSNWLTSMEVAEEAAGTLLDFLGVGPETPETNVVQTTPPPPAAGATRVAGPATERRAFGNGRYVVNRLLGEGAQKSVYLVDDTVLGRQCALSVLNPALLNQGDIGRVKREAQTVAQFGAQPNIVTVYDYGEEDGAPFIVSEYMPGGELRAELDAAAGPLPLERALSVGTNICHALAFAHRHEIIHRDLKPENVWLTEDRSTKLGDFGIALAIDRTRLTMDGTISGTATYMAPEQASGGDVDARSDLYSLGAMLYELVTGQPPFAGNDANAIMYQHVNVPPESPTKHNASVPPVLERLIMRLLAKPKAERPASAAEVLAELERSSAELAGGGGDMYTILFTDMESSTAITQRLGDAGAQEVRRTHNEIVRAALSDSGGTEIKHTGDGIMASFATASGALDCAIAIQRGVAAHKEEHPDSPLGVYVGLNAGEPIAEDGDLFGTSINLAARICDHAEAGQIVAADVVRQLAAGKQFLFSDLGETELRGFEDPVKLWELRWRDDQ